MPTYQDYGNIRDPGAYGSALMAGPAAEWRDLGEIGRGQNWGNDFIQFLSSIYPMIWNALPRDTIRSLSSGDYMGALPFSNAPLQGSGYSESMAHPLPAPIHYSYPGRPDNSKRNYAPPEGNAALPAAPPGYLSEEHPNRVVSAKPTGPIQASPEAMSMAAKVMGWPYDTSGRMRRG
jgi:hypothetical protein